jgi:multisubunit Na+/H+ antiporter MnhG subunit
MSDRSATNVVADVEANSLSTLLPSLIGLLVFVFGIILGVISNSIHWKDIIVFPNYILIYYWFLIAPMLSGILLTVVYYIKQKKLRTFVRKFASDMFTF